jgi:hypothetical protein
MTHRQFSNVATAMDFQTTAFNTTTKGATQYSFSGASSEDIVQNIKEKMVVLNTSLVRGTKSTTTDIGVQFEPISQHVSACIHAINQLPVTERAEWFKKLITIPVYKRDIRGTYGCGERKLSYWVFTQLFNEGFEQTVLELMTDLPNFGSWLDLNKIYDEAYTNRRDSDTSKRFFETISPHFVAMWVNQLRLDNYTFNKLKNKELSTLEKEDSTISLCAKWIPKETSSLAKRTGIHKVIAHSLFSTGSGFNKLKQYRKLVAPLNSAINTTEKLMASKRFDQIKFRLVPGRCLNKFHRCWLDEDKSGSRRHEGDPTRDACRLHYQKFLEDVAAGKTSAKGKSMFVHEIAREIRSVVSNGCYFSYDQGSDSLQSWKTANPERYTLLNAQFNDHFVEIVKIMSENGANFEDTVFQADVSGSMTGDPLDVALSVSAIGATATEGPFHNRVLTFESQSRWVKLEYPKSVHEYSSFAGSNNQNHNSVGVTKFPIGSKFEPSRVGKELDWIEKIYVLLCSGWGGSTNMISALDQIVAIAEQYGVPLPKRAITITDMEWDNADTNSFRGTFKSQCFRRNSQILSNGSYKTLLQKITQCVTSSGYEMPEFVCWNVNGNNRGVPAVASDSKVLMVSGFSVSMLKLFLNTGTLSTGSKDPTSNSWELLDTILSHEDYEFVRDTCNRVGEVRGQTVQAQPMSIKTPLVRKPEMMMPAPQIVNHDGARWEQDVSDAYGCGEVKVPQAPAKTVTSASITDMVDNMSRDDMKTMLQALMNKI